MSIRRIMLAAALACGAPAAAAQAPAWGGADTAWVNFFEIARLRDELADRPNDASFESPNVVGLSFLDLKVELPEPFRSRTFSAQSLVVVDVDSGTRVAGCRPLRAGTHPELDAFACTLLTGPRSASLMRLLQLAAGRRVIGLRWRSLTAAALDAEPKFEGQGATGGFAPPAAAPPWRGMQMFGGMPVTSDYRGIADRRIEANPEARLAVSGEGMPTGCEITSSSGNQAVDERTCALLVERARFTRLTDSSGAPVASPVTLKVDLGRALTFGAPAPRPIRIGQTVIGRLERGDRLMPDGSFNDEYTFTARSAMRLRATMRSDDLTPALWVIVLSGYIPEIVRKTTLGGSEAQVSVDVPAGAIVRIRASTWRGMQGAYTLQVMPN